MVIGERPPSPARLAHTSEKHPRGTLSELNVLRRHRELCDVVLNVGSRKIFAHRFVINMIVFIFWFYVVLLWKLKVLVNEFVSWLCG
jgi:hypothetical protein